MATPVSKTIEKALSLLKLVVEDRGARPLSALANEAGIPVATAHRLITTLERVGFIMRHCRGRYSAGPALLDLASGADYNDVLQRVSRPILRKVACESQQTLHLGVLEDEMVSYLVKEGPKRREIFTREGMQLEAYCSGIGKALLAFLPDEDREAYLAGGPFPRLTPNTIVEVEELRQHLAEVRAKAYAIDDAEVDHGLRCVAVPIMDDEGRVCSAISISYSATTLEPSFIEASLRRLRTAAAELGGKLSPSR